MARISGINLPDEKKIVIGLTAIRGIGRIEALKLASRAKIDFNKRIKDLTGEEISRIQKAVDEVPVEGILRKKVSQDIQRLKSIGSYRGLRHALGLPVRGQRTRCNARTGRGKRKTVGAMKKEMLAKLDTTKKNKESK